MALIKDIPNDVYAKLLLLLAEIARRNPDIAHLPGAPKFFGPNQQQLANHVKGIDLYKDKGKTNAIMVLEPFRVTPYNPQSQNFGCSINVVLTVLMKVKNDQFALQDEVADKALQICFKIISYLTKERGNYTLLREFKEADCVLDLAAAKSEQLYGYTLQFPIKVGLNLLFDETDWLA